MRRFLRIATVGLFALSVIVALAAWGLYRAAQQEPEFYKAALGSEPREQQEAGDELEDRVLELHNRARKEGRWEALFTHEQVNGWLASDLSAKFPGLVPPGVQDPRVRIDPELARVACRFEHGKFETVVSFALDIRLTEETNTLAVHVTKVRAGALPVPLKKFLGNISQAAERADIRLRWTQREGEPLALVTVPIQHEDYAYREVYLEKIELREGEIYLAGRTEQARSDMLAQNSSSHFGPKKTVHR